MADPQSSQRNVTASGDGSVVIGGDVINTAIIIGDIIQGIARRRHYVIGKPNRVCGPAPL